MVRLILLEKGENNNLKNDKITIKVLGGNAEGVTGSSTYVETPSNAFLIEAGLIQDNHSPIETYNKNLDLIQRTNKLKITNIFVTHMHIDHIGLLPAIYRRHPEIVICVPENSTNILREMLLDSAFIMQRDCEKINAKTGRHLLPFYTSDDVNMMMLQVKEYPSGQMISINQDMSIQYIPAGHIYASNQLEIYIKNGAHTSKILYTGDLGNTITENSRVFVDNFIPVKTANIVLGECTYGQRGRGVTEKDFYKDIQKLTSIITQYCVEQHARVLIPTFSLDRTPYVLWLLYQIFGDNPEFNIPIVVDSPLANRLLHCYEQTLVGEVRTKFIQMMNWKNLRFISDAEDSKREVGTKGAKVIISASGMLTAGRSVKWCQSILPKAEDIICLMGYCAEGTLGWKIQHYNDQKTINIDGKICKNRANVVFLKSFSAHMQREQLLKYYSSIHCDKIYLIHGDVTAKKDFAEDLSDRLVNKLQSTKVIQTNKSTVIRL